MHVLVVPTAQSSRPGGHWPSTVPDGLADVWIAAGDVARDEGLDRATGWSSTPGRRPASTVFHAHVHVHRRTG